MKINIPETPSLVLEMLDHAGFEAGIVGGCTRDAILGKIPEDWDICTSATPKEIQSVFKDYKQLNVGLKHGTVVVFINNEKVEITTFRIDKGYSDGRRPDKVTYTRNLLEDLSRRDYTLNAIFYNEKSGIVDHFNGVYHIQNKIIMSVGNADKRFKEDSLRILRGIRLASTLGFNIEKSTKDAMINNKELLKNISNERIVVEFIKMIEGTNAINVCDEFKEIISYIIPETKLTIGFNQNNPYHIHDIWKHTLVAVNNIDGLLLKLAMFFHDIGKPNCYTIDEKGIGHFYGHPEASVKIASEIFNRMRFTSASGINKEDINDILELIKYHDILIEPKKKSIKKMLSRLNGRTVQFQRLLQVKKADFSAQSPDKLATRLKYINEIEEKFMEIINENPCTTLKDLEVNGRDLIEIGVPAGKRMGEILNILLDEVINDNLDNNKEALLNKVKEIEG